MTIQGKALLGLVSVLPLLVLAGIVGPMMYLSFSDPVRLGKLLSSLSTIERLLLSIALLAGTYGPVIFYLRHIAQNPTLKDRRTIWFFLAFLAGQTALPAYWLMFVWKDRHAESTAPRG